MAHSSKDLYIGINVTILESKIICMYDLCSEKFGLDVYLLHTSLLFLQYKFYCSCYSPFPVQIIQRAYTHNQNKTGTSLE